jgi:hypothetical protein
MSVFVKDDEKEELTELVDGFHPSSSSAVEIL